jgi:hypothetical protein
MRTFQANIFSFRTQALIYVKRIEKCPGMLKESQLEAFVPMIYHVKYYTN